MTASGLSRNIWRNALVLIALSIIGDPKMKAMFCFLALSVLSGSVTAQTLPPVSYVEANVPPQSSFAPLLHRDLLAYFKASSVPSARDVEFQLLRTAPTQSGIAYPKYYAWVTVRGGSGLVVDGAVRIAAIDQKKFEVTDFRSRKQIRESPDKLAAVFPAALLPHIISLAGSN